MSIPRKALSRDHAAEVHSEETESPASEKINPASLAVIVIVLITAGGLLVKNGLTKLFGKKPVIESSPSVVLPKAATEEQSMFARVARLIKVNANETPTSITIQDAEQLRRANPTFYKYAQNGDQLFVWSNQAVIYSPGEDLIVGVMPIDIKASATTSKIGAQAQVPEIAKIDVRNGSGTVGLGKTAAAELKQAGLDVLAATDAKRKTYEGSLIYVKPGIALPRTVQTIQDLTGATIVQVWPENENALRGDILLIIGRQYTK